MLIQRITNPVDPRITIYRELKDKDLCRDNAFIIEGKIILETVLTLSRFKLSSIFISEDRILPLETLLICVPTGVPIYVATPEIMAEVAGYNVHRGILAAGIANYTENSLPTNWNNFSRIAVLSNIANPDNIGAIFRNAAGLGIDAVMLDAQCCSPLYRKAIRVSMGATLVLPWFQTGTIKDITENLRREGFGIYALSLQSAANLEDVRFAKRSAFIFGEEAHGLPSHVQALCVTVTIPMSAGTDSLNVAASSAIVFDAARRQLT